MPIWPGTPARPNRATTSTSDSILYVPFLFSSGGFGSRPFLRNASRSTNSICALRLRKSSFDQRVIADRIFSSILSAKALRAAIVLPDRSRPICFDQVYSEPVFRTGCAPSSPHKTTRRLLTIAALRSSSSSTTFFSLSNSSAMSTMPTAPETI